MAAGMPFTAAHISSLAARAAELERIGEDLQDPDTLIRAARLYRLAVRIADDIDQRPSAAFTRGDLARVRDELRTLAADAAAGIVADYGVTRHGTIDATGGVTRAFREMALRIEQRIADDEARPRPRPDLESRA